MAEKSQEDTGDRVTDYDDDGQHRRLGPHVCAVRILLVAKSDSADLGPHLCENIPTRPYSACENFGDL